MKQHIKPPLCEADRHVLAIVRHVSGNLGAITKAVNEIGVALADGRITPGQALIEVERVAPNMYHASWLAEIEAERFKDEILASWKSREVRK